MAVNKFRRFYNFLANMGLVLRDDPPKAIDMTGRVWGEEADGLALSIRELKRDDPAQVAGISVVMRNTGAAARSLSVPPWIFYYKVEGLELSPYGKQLLDPARQAKNVDVTLKPGDAVETDLPIATLYNMRAPGDYRVRVSCPVGRSNEIVIRV